MAMTIRTARFMPPPVAMVLLSCYRMVTALIGSRTTIFLSALDGPQFVIRAA